MKYFKLREAAALLEVSPNTLRNWDRSGKFKAARHPQNKYRIYSRSALTSFTREATANFAATQAPITSLLSHRQSDHELSSPILKGSRTDIRNPRFLKRTFRQLSRAFRDSEGGGLLERFDEISKLLFCKILDEKERIRGTPSIFAQPGTNGSSDIYERLSSLYTKISRQYPLIFSGERGRLSPDKKAVLRVLEILRDIPLASISGDIKGAAYEELIRDTFEKTENQQFFTPRVIVEFMVRFADPSPQTLVCDPACGSGGFLIATMEHLLGRLDPKDFSRGRTPANRFSKNHVLVGAEIDRRMAWVSQLNLLMHGDGQGQVSYLPAGGSLAYTQQTQKILPENYFDLILTNPPFGSDFSDATHLRRYVLGTGRTSRRRGVLFLERCLRLLKPGGRLGIIIDDSVLSGPANEDARRFIFDNAIVEAVISLPDVAFMPYASVKASILFIQKKSTCAQHQSDVFMANVENVGHRPNGDPLYSEERDERGQLQLLNDLPMVLRTWNAHRHSGEKTRGNLSQKIFLVPERKFYDKKALLANNRLDTLFYHPAKDEAENVLARSRYPTPRLAELVVNRYVSTVPSLTQPDETCRYVGLADISAGTGECEITDIRCDRLKSAVRLFKGGDLLFAKLRPELRKCVFIPDHEEDGFVSSECLVLRGLDRLSGDRELGGLLSQEGTVRYEVDSEYLAFMLRSELTYGQLIYQCTGVGRPRVLKSDVLNVRIPLPPIKIQHQLVAIFKGAWRHHIQYQKESQSALAKARGSLHDAHQTALMLLCSSK